MSHASMKPIARKGILCGLLVACGVYASTAAVASSVAEAGVAGGEAASGHSQEVQRVHVRIVVGSKSMAATLEDNPTARDFASLLPLTLTLRDFSPAEKVSGALPKRLSEEGAPPSAAGAVGDIAYYAPWRNIAFYRGRGPDASGVIRIARITSGMEALDQPGQVPVTISRAD
jgi:hypothetical protein